MSSVTVNGYSLEDKTITENGIYTPSSGYDGIGSINVNVPSSGYNVLKEIGTCYNLFNGKTTDSEEIVLDFENNVPSSMYQMFDGAGGVKKVTFKNLGYPSNNGLNMAALIRTSSIKELYLINCDLIPNNAANMLRSSTIERIEGGEIDCTYITASSNSTILYGTSKLQEARFKKRTLGIGVSFGANAFISASNETCVSFANGFKEISPATSISGAANAAKTKFNSIYGYVNENDDFVADNENPVIDLRTFMSTYKNVSFS